MEAFLFDPTTIALAHLQAFLLIFIRITGMFDRMPVVGGASVPRTAKIWFAFLVAVVLFPVVMSIQTTPVMPQSIGVFFMAVLSELGLGLLLGFAGSLLLTGMQLGGRIVDDQMGFSLANVIDPMSNETVSVTSQLVFFFATLIFIVMGGLNLLIQILADSFRIVPLIGFSMHDEFIWHLLNETFPQSLMLAIAFAAPSIVVGVLATMALGLLGRVVPEMNIFSFSFGVRVLAGLIMLALSVRYMPGLMDMVYHGTEVHLRELLHYAR